MVLTRAWQTKDASAPVIPPDASVKVPDVAGAKSAVKAVEGKEWREELKHVQPVRRH